MSETSLIERLEQKVAAEGPEREIQLLNLALAVAGGEAIADDEVLRRLQAIDKTPSDLEAAIQRLEQRRKWAADLQRLPELRKQEDELREAIDAEVKRFLKLRAQHEEKLQELYAREAPLRSRFNAGIEAQRKLFASLLPHEQERLTQLRKNAAALRNRLEFLDADLNANPSFSSSRDTPTAVVLRQVLKQMDAYADQARQTLLPSLVKSESYKRDEEWKRLEFLVNRYKQTIEQRTKEREDLRPKLESAQAELQAFERDVVYGAM